MKILTIAFAASFLALGGASYGATYQDEMTRWESFVEANKFGVSQDFWLEKDTPWGWERVALIMGYGDDYEACNDIKETLEAKYWRGLYRCMPANLTD